MYDCLNVFPKNSCVENLVPNAAFLRDETFERSWVSSFTDEWIILGVTLVWNCSVWQAFCVSSCSLPCHDPSRRLSPAAEQISVPHPYSEQNKPLFCVNHWVCHIKLQQQKVNQDFSYFICLAHRYLVVGRAFMGELRCSQWYSWKIRLIYLVPKKSGLQQCG